MRRGLVTGAVTAMAVGAPLIRCAILRQIKAREASDPLALPVEGAFGVLEVAGAEQPGICKTLAPGATGRRAPSRRRLT